MPSANLSFLDYAVIVAYLLVTLYIGYVIGKRIKSGSDYFLAGRSLPWWAVGFSLVATDIGGTDIIGGGGVAYRWGVAIGNFEWIGCVPAMIVAAFVFVPFFWRHKIATVPEYLERRYNPAVRTALALCWLLFMACNLGIMLLASSKLMSVLLGLDQWICIVLTAVLVGIYTFSGGLAAVVYTDVLQCTVMIAGCLLVAGIGVAQLGGFGALSDRIAEIDPQRLSLVLPVDTPSPFPWTGIFFGLALVLSPAYWIGNQAIIQRAFGARSEFHARASYVWGAVLKSVIPVIIVVPGLVATLLVPGLEDAQGDEAVPRLVGILLPVGLRGVFVAAFCAALMSTVDSYLNSAATLFTLDIYKRFLHAAADERRLMWVGRIVTILLALWAILAAFLFMRLQEGVYTIFQTLMSFFQGPALAVLLTGLLWRRATGVAALTGFIVGVLCAISLYALNQPAVCDTLGCQQLFQISQPFLYISVWAFLVALVLVVLISLLTKPEPPEKTRFVVYANAGSA
jgi:SSS family solute:Na+ symporter